MRTTAIRLRYQAIEKIEVNSCLYPIGLIIQLSISYELIY